ncbi:MAG: hypothetical protein HUU50_01015 [Candidatus Brocadiae bacterium]|nr:hypothetical protein [Candidatus Brocadiia bacterium]
MNVAILDEIKNRYSKKNKSYLGKCSIKLSYDQKRNIEEIIWYKMLQIYEMEDKPSFSYKDIVEESILEELGKENLYTFEEYYRQLLLELEDEDGEEEKKELKYFCMEIFAIKYLLMQTILNKTESQELIDLRRNLCFYLSYYQSKDYHFISKLVVDFKKFLEFQEGKESCYPKEQIDNDRKLFKKGLLEYLRRKGCILGIEEKTIEAFIISYGLMR